MSAGRSVRESGRPAASASPFRQPKGVWAVAFACVVSFMGIGLVDPILPALSSQLEASPSAVELLFTSYLVVTAVAMLVTGWVSSRIGGKRTLNATIRIRPATRVRFPPMRLDTHPVTSMATAVTTR